MKPSPQHATKSTATRLLLAALLAGVVLTGCLIIPVDYHATGSRHNVRLEATNSLLAGVTTLEDVLLALGEPDFVSEDGRRAGYFWTKVKAIWAVASYGPGAGGEITRSYLIEISYDQSNRVSSVRLQKEWGESVTARPEARAVP